MLPGGSNTAASRSSESEGRGGCTRRRDPNTSETTTEGGIGYKTQMYKSLSADSANWDLLTGRCYFSDGTGRMMARVHWRTQTKETSQDKVWSGPQGVHKLELDKEKKEYLEALLRREAKEIMHSLLPILTFVSHKHTCFFYGINLAWRLSYQGTFLLEQKSVFKNFYVRFCFLIKNDSRMFSFWLSLI